jgi:hypothetical protein
VSPADDQPLHVLLSAVRLPVPWTSPTRVLLRFTDWPATRPEFFIDRGVVNSAGDAPRSSSEAVVLGENWLQFSFGFPWRQDAADAVGAVQLWLTRFSEAT